MVAAILGDSGVDGYLEGDRGSAQSIYSGIGGSIDLAISGVSEEWKQDALIEKILACRRESGSDAGGERVQGLVDRAIASALTAAFADAWRGALDVKVESVDSKRCRFTYSLPKSAQDDESKS